MIINNILLEGIQADFKKLHGDKLFADFMSVRDKLKMPEKDMSYWMNKSSDELERFLNNFTPKKSNREVVRDSKQGADLLYDKDGIQILFIKTYEAMTYYGKGTKWCIAGNYPEHEGRGQEYFDEYIDTEDLCNGYYVVITGNNKYCLLISSDDKLVGVWDSLDKNIDISGLPNEALSALSSVGVVKEFNIRDKVLVSFNNIYNKEVPFIPDGVEEIERDAFECCKYITSVVIPDSVKTIGNCAFTYCQSLESIVIPDSVTSFGSHIFQGCGNLKNVVLGKGISNILAYTFDGCDNLRDLSIPDNIININNKAFYRCNNLNIHCSNKVSKLLREVDFNGNIIIEESFNRGNRMRFVFEEFLDEGIKQDFINKFGKDLSNKFFQMRNAVSGDEKSMEYWVNSSKTSDDLLDFMTDFHANSKRTSKKNDINGGSEVIADNGRFKVLQVYTYEAMKHIGANTTWCLSGRYPNHGGDEQGRYWWNEYSDTNDIYVLSDKSADWENRGRTTTRKMCILTKHGSKEVYEIWEDVAPDGEGNDCIYGSDRYDSDHAPFIEEFNEYYEYLTDIGFVLNDEETSHGLSDDDLAGIDDLDIDWDNDFREEEHPHNVINHNNPHGNLGIDADGIDNYFDTVYDYDSNINDGVVTRDMLDGATIVMIGSSHINNIIADNAFTKVSGLIDRFVFNRPLIQVGDNAFKNCKGELKPSFDADAKIGESAFENSSIDFSDIESINVASIGKKAFCDCNDVSSVTVNKDTVIAQDAFKGTNVGAVVSSGRNDTAYEFAKKNRLVYSDIDSTDVYYNPSEERRGIGKRRNENWETRYIIESEGKKTVIEAIDKQDAISFAGLIFEGKEFTVEPISVYVPEVITEDRTPGITGVTAGNPISTEKNKDNEKLLKKKNVIGWWQQGQGRKKEDENNKKNTIAKDGIEIFANKGGAIKQFNHAMGADGSSSLHTTNPISGSMGGEASGSSSSSGASSGGDGGSSGGASGGGAAG